MADEGRGRTAAQRAGGLAETLVAGRLADLGWVILARNIHSGRSELDLVAVDPGPPARLVVIEVRRRSSRDFGGGEASFDARKRAHVRRGIGRLMQEGRLPDGTTIPPLPIAVDLAVVEPGPDGRDTVRLYRDALA